MGEREKQRGKASRRGGVAVPVRAPDVVEEGVQDGGKARADASLLANAGKGGRRQVPGGVDAVQDNVQALLDALVVGLVIVDGRVKLVRVGAVALVHEVVVARGLGVAELDVLGGVGLGGKGRRRGKKHQRRSICMKQEQQEGNETHARPHTHQRHVAARAAVDLNVRVVLIAVRHVLGRQGQQHHVDKEERKHDDGGPGEKGGAAAR